MKIVKRLGGAGITYAVNHLYKLIARLNTNLNVYRSEDQIHSRSTKLSINIFRDFSILSTEKKLQF